MNGLLEGSWEFGPLTGLGFRGDYGIYGAIELKVQSLEFTLVYRV